MKSFFRMSYPYILWIGFFIVAPMFMILLYAVTKGGNNTLTFRFTLENFGRFFSDPDFMRVLWTSLRIAFITTVVCILIGYPAALFIANLSERKQTMMILLMTLPMWINMLLKTYAWRGILMNFDDMGSEIMGVGLDDHYVSGLARGNEWRTIPLWGIGLQNTVNGHTYFLHDGRARNFTEAIMWHGGEAEASKNIFARMPKEDRSALITFLKSL